MKKGFEQEQTEDTEERLKAKGCLRRQGFGGQEMINGKKGGGRALGRGFSGRWHRTGALVKGYVGPA
jgi:hypothetical protein